MVSRASNSIMKTFKFPEGFFALALVVGSFLQVHGCLNKSKPRTAQYHSTLYLDYLQELLEDEDTTAFTDEVRSQREADAPTIQDLTNMLNDIDRGELPQFMKDKNYTLVMNLTSIYNYSTTNSGTVSTQGYGTIKSQGDVGTVSCLDFGYIHGSVGSYNYTAGTGFYVHSRYTKGKSAVHFQTSILGSTFFKMPGGIYVSSGNFTGIGQGVAVSYSSQDVATSVKTLAIFHTSQYYSKNIMTSNEKKGATELNVISLTGGTNTTINLNTTTLPEANRNYIVNMNGTLQNSKQRATLTSETEGKLMVDFTEPFSDQNLFFYFGQTRQAADIYLP